MSGGQIFSPILYGVLDAVEGFCFVGFLGCQRPTWKSCTCGTAQGCIPSLEANAAALLIVRRSLWSLWQSFRFSFNFLCFGVLSRNIIACAVCWNTSAMFSPRSFKFSNFKFGLWINFDWLLYRVRNLSPVSVFGLRMSSVPQHHFFCVWHFRWDPIHWTRVPRSVWDRILSCWSRCLYVHAMLSYWLWLCKMSWNQVLWGLQHLAGFYSRLLWLFAMVSASVWILGSVLTHLWEWLYQSLSIYICCTVE